MSCSNDGQKCLTCGAVVGVDKQASNSSGFFSNFEGGGERNTDSCQVKPSCEQEKCDCNCALKNHLSDCCGLGQLPPAPQPAAPGVGPQCRPAISGNCAAGENNTDSCQVKPSCGNTDPCQVKPSCEQDKCDGNCALKNHLSDCCGLGQLPPAPGAGPQCRAATSGNCAVCGKAAFEPPPVVKPKACCRLHVGRSGGKCPPMPCSDVSNCVPNWICTGPVSTFRDYPVPCGAEILPISSTGRIDSKQPKADGKCKINPDCPMMRPRCPRLGIKEEESPGIFAKIGTMFGLGGAKK